MSASRIVFAGTPAFAVPSLRALLEAPGLDVVGVVSQPDRPAGRGMRLAPSPVKQLALEAGLEVLTPERLRGNDQALDWLHGLKPDLLVVVAFGMLLPRAWLDAPRVAPVNAHASLLPRWRGAAPIERALLAGDAETGVSIMRMEEGLDTGGVYAMRRMPLDARITGAMLREALAEMSAGLLVETLPGIVDGSLVPQPQDETRATYAAKLTAADRVPDWTQSARAVDRVVRCFAPRPGARARLDGRWLKLLAGRVLDDVPKDAPGSVHGGDGRLIVDCGEGRYELTEVQPEGRKPMAAADFLRGHDLPAGARFS